MSLDIFLTATRKTEVYGANITHNLGKMAMAVKCGDHSLYEYLWTPEKIGIKQAEKLIKPLREGLAELKAKPEVYKRYDAENGWGLYIHFVPFVDKYLKACEENPDAEIEVSR